MAGVVNLPGLATGNATTSAKGQFQVSGVFHEGDCHLDQAKRLERFLGTAYALRDDNML